MVHEIILTVGLVTSAFFAVYLEEPVYAVVSLALMNIILSLFYFSLNAPFAAVFQLAIGIGTVAVLLLTGEMFTRKTYTAKTIRKKLLGLVASVLLSIPSILSVGAMTTTTRSSNFSISTALWDLRFIDVIAQGLVVLTIALGIAMILRKKRSDG
ncbi:MAG: NADH-quinone oxidoreductase subunit J [Candidatus Bathyarchaeota archaeon]|nr:NADH-quinone oxidoreductase subunit J [Candidatus Bathyarchaeota archaeon]MDH5595918.1 NADH-quinone oxidoreductase subunit J [Candidatus Bathyarchaeota archaeon]